MAAVSGGEASLVDGAAWGLDDRSRIVHLGQSAVAFQRPDAPTLTVITSAERGLVPGGLCLPRRLFERWRGEPERELAAAARELAADAAPVDLRVRRVVPHSGAVIAWRSHVLATDDAWLSATDQRNLAPSLAQALLAADQAATAAAIAGLVGRGPGSTPSGDDVIVGALAAAHAVGLPVAAAHSLGKQLALTTTPSRHDLWWALRGRVSQRLLALLASFTDPHLVPTAASRARGWGHTSGLDLAAGATAVFAAVLDEAANRRSIA